MLTHVEFRSETFLQYECQEGTVMQDHADRDSRNSLETVLLVGSVRAKRGWAHEDFNQFPSPIRASAGRNEDESPASPNRGGGTYDVKLTYTPDVPANRGEPGPNDISIFTAVQQLGLKLEPQRAQIEVLLIDRIEKPTEN